MTTQLLSLPELKIAELRQGAISYREAGRGAPILCLHGLNGNAKSWRAQFGLLGGRHRVIAWDAPGYGQSGVVDGGANAYADAAAELLTALDAAPAIVVGHSMGGIVAGRLAARHPEVVSHLVLSCTHWGGCSEGSPLDEKYLERLDERRALPSDDYGRTRAAKMLPPNATADVFQEVADIASEVPLAGIENAAHMLHEADNRPELASLAMPILILDGAMDPVLKPQRAALLAELLPNARRVTFEALGHVPYLESPEIYSQAITQFLKAANI